MQTSLITAAVAIIALLLLSGCMVDAEGNKRLDPEARKFWGGVAVQVILKSAAESSNK